MIARIFSRSAVGLLALALAFPVVARAQDAPPPEYQDQASEPASSEVAPTLEATGVSGSLEDAPIPGATGVSGSLEVAPETDATTVPFLHFGPLVVHLSLAVSEKYTDNVFSTSEDTESDFITSVMPGIQLTLAEGYNLENFTFGVNASTANASSFSELNRIDWNIYGRGAFTIGERLTIEIGDTYSPGHITPLDSTSGELESATSNAAMLGLRFAFLDLWQASLGYTRTNFDFSDSENRSRNEDLVSAGLSFRILPKTSTFVRYDFTNVGYSDSASTLDNTRQGISVGATWEITEITKGTVDVGYRSVDFEDAAEKGTSTWGAKVDLSHELNEFATLSLEGGRSIEEGKYAGTRDIVATGLSAKLTYRFIERFTSRVNAGYGTEVFSDVNPGDTAVREDKTFRAGVGIGYDFRSWLLFDLSYGYLNRNSNIDWYSIQENTVTISATARI